MRFLFIIIIAGLLVAAAIFIFARTPHSGSAAMETLAREYYADKIVNSPTKSNSYTLVAKNLKLLGYDISTIESFGCSPDSYAVVFLDPTNGEISDLKIEMSGC